MEMMEIVLQCPFCGQPHTVNVDIIDYFNWIDGELAQNVFTYLTATEREQLISGICPECQKGIFGESEE